MQCQCLQTINGSVVMTGCEARKSLWSRFEIGVVRFMKQMMTVHVCENDWPRTNTRKARYAPLDIVRDIGDEGLSETDDHIKSIEVL